MSHSLAFVVGADEADRADKVIARRFPGTSRRRLAALFRAGHVRIDGRRAKKGELAAAGSRVVLEEPPADDEALRPMPDPHVALSLLHRDEWFVAVNKPSGMPSHPLDAGELGCVANGLAHEFPPCVTAGDDPREAGLVHRLDTGTSGVLLAALDPQTWRLAREMFHRGQVTKSYVALVHGATSGGRTDARLLQRGPRAVVDERGLSATTEWHAVETFRDYTLVRCVTTSGRMHQVRAHLGHAGHPLAGDPRYGGVAIANAPLVGHFLHADHLTLCHPHSGRPLLVEAELPQDREATLTLLRRG